MNEMPGVVLPPSSRTSSTLRSAEISVSAEFSNTVSAVKRRKFSSPVSEVRFCEESKSQIGVDDCYDATISKLKVYEGHSVAGSLHCCLR